MNRKIFAKVSGGIAATIASLAVSTAAFAQDATPTIDKGDTAWMLTSTLLVFELRPRKAVANPADGAS